MAGLVESPVPREKPVAIEECRALHRQLYCLMEQKYPAGEVEKMIEQALHQAQERHEI